MNGMIDRVVTGNGAWVITESKVAYPVMHFIYWHRMEVFATEHYEANYVSVEVFGEKFGNEQALPKPFKGHVFQSEKAARRYCKNNGYEFNEGEL
jgi:hypothetical protein